jgi:hypothetical protein
MKSLLISSKKKIPFIICFSIIFILFFACGIYFADYYRADFETINQFVAASEKSTKILLENDTILFQPSEKAKVGFIFYPGGKVEYNAYEPVLAKLADEGIACFLVKMPFNLAVFNINAAEKILNQFSEIEDWYIGGHSLGGSMAASFLGKNQDDIKGLILLASYSTVDFSNSDIKILSIFGSEDRVLNLEKYAEYKPYLSKNTSEFVIEGGNHAGFGFYGNQEGDGTATISSQEQIEKTAELIAEFVLK